MACPTCKQKLGDDRRYRPFCCERCKLIDLGRWLDGSYAIPGEPASEHDLDAELAGLPEGPPPDPRRRH